MPYGVLVVSEKVKMTRSESSESQRHDTNQRIVWEI